MPTIIRMLPVFSCTSMARTFPHNSKEIFDYLSQFTAWRKFEHQVRAETSKTQCPICEMIYTGPIDEYCDFRYGKLPYRSLKFRHETHDMEVFRPAPVINYPNDYDYTRVTEFKYLTGQKHKKTSIVYDIRAPRKTPIIRSRGCGTRS